MEFPDKIIRGDGKRQVEYIPTTVADKRVGDAVKNIRNVMKKHYEQQRHNLKDRKTTQTIVKFHNKQLGGMLFDLVEAIKADLRNAGEIK